MNYVLNETEDGLSLELSGTGRLWAALRRGVRSAVIGFGVLMALVLIDLLMQPYLWVSGLMVAGMGAVVAGVTFGVLGWLSRARWELDMTHGLARWRMKTAIGQEAEGEMPVSQIVDVSLEGPVWPWRVYEVRLHLQSGQQETIASEGKAEHLTPIVKAVRARLSL